MPMHFSRGNLVKIILSGILGFYLSGCNVAKLYVRHVDRKYDRFGFEERNIHTDSLNIHFFIGGEGNPLLMIHGFGGDGKITWSQQIKELSEHYRVIVPDLLWFGKSFSSKAPSLNLQAQAMSILLDSLRMNRASVVGMSYGGFVAFEMCRQDPEELKRMIIVDSPGPVYQVSEVQGIVDRTSADSIEQIFAPADYHQLKWVFGISFRKPKHIPGFIRKDIYQEFYSNYRKERVELLEELERNASVYQRTKVSDRLQVCIIWGREDRVFPVSNGKRLAKVLDAPIDVIPKAGHAVNSDQKKKFNKALLQCLGK